MNKENFLKLVSKVPSGWREKAKKGVVPYVNNTVWADNDVARKFREVLDTPQARMYSGRRIFRIQNRPLIRKVLDAAHYPSNFR